MMATLRGLQTAQKDARKGNVERARRVAQDIHADINDYMRDRTTAAYGDTSNLGQAIIDLGIDLRRIITFGTASNDGVWAGWVQQAASVRARTEDNLKAAEREEQSEAKDAWKTWIMDGAAAGAKNAHRAVKLPVE